MSQATKRKHVTQQLLESYDLPSEEQEIVRVRDAAACEAGVAQKRDTGVRVRLSRLQVTGGRGNNLHEVENQNGERFLVSMPRQFRRNVWMKRGSSREAGFGA